MASQAAPATCTTDLSFLLAQASHVLATELTAALAEVGLTPRAHCVLTKALAGEHTQGRIGELCGLDKTTMVVTIDELERRGLAERRPSASDRRARVIAVTDEGRQVVEQGRAIAERVYVDVLDALPETRREAFVEGLEQLAGGRLSTPVRCDRPPRRRAL